METKKTIQNIEVHGKRCLVRVDFNVPLEEENGKMVVSDRTRLTETLPTIEYLRKESARIILCSHLGRPGGKPDPKQSLRPVSEVLSQMLNSNVQFVEDSVGEKVEAAANALKPGEILLLENVRFYPEEEKNDETFARKLAAFADIYVNDAFGSSHRAHASTAGVAKFAPAAVAGLLMQKELRFLNEELKNPTRPFIALLGGAKVSDKIKVIDKLLEKVDTLLIGGAMAYTFDLALGRKVGNSLCEPDKIDMAKNALEKANKLGVRLLLPTDRLIAQKVDFKARTVSETRVVDGDIPDGWEGVDIGPATIVAYEKEISSASTILWNGPMGIFEIEACAKGTFAVAQAVAKNKRAKSIIGGGDSAKAIQKAGVADQVSFISTGGGASLELLEGKDLPGVAALKNKASTCCCGKGCHNSHHAHHSHHSNC